MQFKFFAVTMLATVLILSSVSCQNPKSDSGDVAQFDARDSMLLHSQDRYLIADTTWGEYQVALFASDTLTSKHENIFIQVTNADGSPASDVDVDFVPYMDMGMMSYGGPYSSPKKIRDGLFRGEVVYIMANMQGMGNGWMLNTILTKDGKRDTLSIQTPVQTSKLARTTAVGTANDGRMFVSAILGDTLPVGKTAVHFQLHKIQNEVFPVASGYSIELDPFMSDMGHGSSGNKNAVELEPGMYEGLLNFSMPGQWDIRVNIIKDDKVISQDTLKFPVFIK